MQKENNPRSFKHLQSPKGFNSILFPGVCLHASGTPTYLQNLLIHLVREDPNQGEDSFRDALIFLNSILPGKMSKESGIKIFEQKQVRAHWNERQEKCYFAVVDDVAALTDSFNPQVYLRVLEKS